MSRMQSDDAQAIGETAQQPNVLPRFDGEIDDFGGAWPVELPVIWKPLPARGDAA